MKAIRCQLVSNYQHERLAAENTTDRVARLQQMSVCQHKRLVAESAAERDTRLSAVYLSPVDDVHIKIFKQCWWCVRGRWEGGQQCSVTAS